VNVRIYILCSSRTIEADAAGQPASDCSRKPSNRLPLISARPAVTFQLHSITTLGQYQFILLGEQRHVSERLV